MIHRAWRVAWLLLTLGLAGWAAVARAESGEAFLLKAEGPVTPSMAEYIVRGIRAAERDGAEVIVLQLNTPGGSVDVMERIVRDIRASSVPVVVYVAPRGAIAGSAGTVITVAGHVSAMAPETAIGAASPVGGQGEDLGTTLDTKVKEILKAEVRSLMADRSPEAIELAEATIDEARAASAAEALEAGMIDIIAADTADLLRQLDGRTVTLSIGPRTLRTAGASTVELRMNLLEEVLHLLTNPNVVFLLLAVGSQAILIELASPGGWVAGFTGVVSLALAFYGLGVLPVNWFGLIFIAAAFVLFILDIKAPTHGALTATGIASFILGALILFNSPGTEQFYQVSIPLVVGTAVVTAGLFFAVVTFAIRAQYRPVTSGVEALKGQVGEVRQALAPQGTVHVAGELWSAEATDRDAKVGVGKKVEVVDVQGLRLLVRPIPDSN